MMRLYLARPSAKWVWVAREEKKKKISCKSSSPLETVSGKTCCCCEYFLLLTRGGEQGLWVFLATCHTLLLLHHGVEHEQEDVLIVHPTWQPIIKQLEYCRVSAEDESSSPCCSPCRMKTESPKSGFLKYFFNKRNTIRHCERFSGTGGGLEWVCASCIAPALRRALDLDDSTPFFRVLTNFQMPNEPLGKWFHKELRH